MAKNIIIAILLVFLVVSYAYGMKIPDIILGKNVDPDLKEIIEDYVIKILNEGRYTMSISGSAIASSTELDAGEFKMDNSGVTKYLCLSNGTTNYRVEITAIP